MRRAIVKMKPGKVAGGSGERIRRCRLSPRDSPEQTT